MKSFQNGFSTSVYSVFNALILLVLSLLFFACKKDTDEEKPDIIIESPYENETFSTVDTLTVVAQITDNEQVKSVSVELLDDQYGQMGSKGTYSASGSSFNLLIDFALDQPFATSGTYFLAVRASDGSNIGSAFVQVQLQAIPREIDQFVAVTTAGGMATVRTSTDFDSWTERVQVQTDFAGAALNYRDDILGIAGGDMGDAVFYETNEFSIENGIPNYGSPSLDYFLGLDFNPDSRKFILLQRDPKYRLLDENGLPVGSQPLNPAYLPRKSFQPDDRIFIDQKALSSPNRILAMYTRQGLLLNTYVTDGPTRLVSQFDSDRDFVWIDSDEGVKLFLANGSILEPLYSRTGEELFAACEIGMGTFLISTSTGIYRYTYPEGSTVVLNQNYFPTGLAYDPIDGIIYGFESNTVRQLSFSGNEIGMYSFADSLVFFGLDYNR